MSVEDFYETLGLQREASAEQVRRAYRRLARLYHPDTSGRPESDRFRQIQEAYEILSDPEARTAYDARFAEQIPIRGSRRPEPDLVYEVHRSQRFESGVFEVRRARPRDFPRDDSFDRFVTDLFRGFF